MNLTLAYAFPSVHQHRGGSTTASPSGEKKYLTKAFYFSLPIFGWLQYIAGDIGVDVKDANSRKESMERCRGALSGGSSLVIYPEGTEQTSGAVTKH